MPLKYRADVDGLRAIAVVVVIFFHAHIPGFSGGFVGVDVFFVISGFLITSIILKEIHDGQFSVARFYERRIRRILPALIPVIIFTVFVGAFLLDYKDFERFGESITAASLFASNILFWKQEGYFGTASITKPLLHTWSLAVEEQFYIFFPLLLFAINRFWKSRYLYFLLAIGIISLFTSIYGVYDNREAAFYFLPPRAWELLAGSILALGVVPLLRSNVQRNIFAIAGLGLIAYCVRFYNEATLFPGVNALAPVMGACLIIYSGMGGGSIVSRLLTLKPLVYIGLISYSLYLWHWPLIAFTKYLTFRELSALEVSGIILTTFVISVFSLKFIEQPFRGDQPIIPDRKKLFALSAVIMIVISVLGGVIIVQNGMTYRFPKVSAALAKQFDDDFDWNLYSENQQRIERLHEGVIPPIIGAKDVTPSFIVWGDSHAGMLTHALSEKGKRYGLSGFVVAHNTSLPLLDIDYPVNSFHVARFNQSVINFIKAHPNIKTVIIAAFWTTLKDMDNNSGPKDISGEYTGNQPYSVLLRAGLTRVVQTLSTMGRRVVLVSDVPVFKSYYADPVRVFWLSAIYGIVPDYNTILPNASEYLERNKDVLGLLRELSMRSNVTVLHPESLLFDNKGRAIMMLDSNLMYRDAIHLSRAGTNLIAPVFDDVFRKMAADQGVLNTF